VRSTSGDEGRNYFRGESTIGLKAAVLNRPRKATFTFTFYLRTSNLCNHRRRLDTLLHRLTDCNEQAWTLTRIAAILRIDPRHIPSEWTIRPGFQFWPRQKQGAILWIIAHMVSCCTQHSHPLTLTDYADFMRRARWKAYQAARQRDNVGNYLVIL
jgi:hypothetical protein